MRGREIDLDILRRKTRRVRERIVRMSAGGGAFLGSALSCADIILMLYCEILRITPATLDDPNRDYFFLSKGHAVPSLYAVLAEEGMLDEARLSHHLKPSDLIYWHPNATIPGVEFHSGSLGHLLAVGVGVALDCKMNGTDNKVIVLVGDGELNEGSNWEALMLASAHKLDNLLVIVDRNGLQANRHTEDLIPLEPLEEKFTAFGASVTTVDGHDIQALRGVFSQIPLCDGSPSVIIARTVRGKGFPDIESRVDRWFCTLSPDEVARYVGYLEAAS